MTPAPGRDAREAERTRLASDIAALVDRLSDGSRDDTARDALLARLYAWQCAHVEPVARIAATGAHANPTDAGIGSAPSRRTLAPGPAVPTDVFRFVRVAAHGAHEDARVFRTSGTTAGARGAHHLRDLSLYARAARAAARYAIFADVERMPLLVLAAPEAEAPESSLSYMLARFIGWFGTGDSVTAWCDRQPEFAAWTAALAKAERTRTAVALVGTSLALVHAEEALGDRRFALAPGSRLVHTGGFKGRAREVEPASLVDALGARYGIQPTCIVQEYGMTELSSQCYELGVRETLAPRSGAATRDRQDAAADPGARSFWVPGWMRATVVDAEHLAPVPEGEVGLLRIDDLANLDTACAVQTSDLARAVDGGFVLLGRAPGATPRGCSLAIEAVRAARDASPRRDDAALLR